MTFLCKQIIRLLQTCLDIYIIVCKEVNMKKILLVALFMFFVQLQSGAATSVDRTLSEEYLINNGYSKQIYDTVNVGRARALGEPYYSQEEIEAANATGFKKFKIRLRNYFDPAADDFSFYHHDNRPVPYYGDL